MSSFSFQPRTNAFCHGPNQSPFDLRCISSSSSVLSKRNGHEQQFAIFTTPIIPSSPTILSSGLSNFDMCEKVFSAGQQVPAINSIEADASESANVRSNMMQEGYEYVHPDIAAMLLENKITRNVETVIAGSHGKEESHRKSLEEKFNTDCTGIDDGNKDQNCLPFEICPETLTLKRSLNEGIDFDVSSMKIMPVRQLACLANACEKVVVGKTLKCDKNLRDEKEARKSESNLSVPQRIMGLIYLSKLRLPSSSQTIINDGCFSLSDYLSEISDEKGDSDGEPATVVAAMVALNLLESSIRSIFLEFGANSQHNETIGNSCEVDTSGHENNESIHRINSSKSRRSSKNSKHQNKKGSPLLKDMIEVIASVNSTVARSPQKLMHSESKSTHQSRILPPSFLAPILRSLLLPTKDDNRETTTDNNESSGIAHDDSQGKRAKDGGNIETGSLVGGINLRNLLSHGFLSSLDHRWLALTIVLIQSLECWKCFNSEFSDKTNGDADLNHNHADSLPVYENIELVGQSNATSLRKYAPLATEIRRGEEILMGDEFYSNIHLIESQLCGNMRTNSSAYLPPHFPEQFFPASHVPLLKFAFYVLAPMLQHSISSTFRGDDTTKDTTIGIHSDSEQKLIAPTPVAAIFVLTLSVILEHSLRLVWCHANKRSEDRIARPSKYYVTLDGHGQRQLHDVMISPFLRDKSTRNKMISVIGAPATALLADLFAAPSVEAPNIRSAVCHGVWDNEIVKDLEMLAVWGTHERKIYDNTIKMNTSNQVMEVQTKYNVRRNSCSLSLLDAAYALLSSLELVSSNAYGRPRLSKYRPVYSYTAMATTDLGEVLTNLAVLKLLISSDSSVANSVKSVERQQFNLCCELKSLEMELDIIQKMANSLFPTMMKAECEVWKVEDIYREHESNVILSNCGVAQKLLSDVSLAIKRYIVEVQGGAAKLSLHPTCTKERRVVKSMTRFCGVASIVFTLYTFSVYVALVAIKFVRDNSPCEAVNHDNLPSSDMSRADIVRAVERTRMMLSTFDSCLLTNLDRSLKAVQQYLQGKVVKKVTKNIDQARA